MVIRVGATDVRRDVGNREREKKSQQGYIVLSPAEQNTMGRDGTERYRMERNRTHWNGAELDRAE